MHILSDDLEEVELITCLSLFFSIIHVNLGNTLLFIYNISCEVCILKFEIYHFLICYWKENLGEVEVSVDSITLVMWLRSLLFLVLNSGDIVVDDEFLPPQNLDSLTNCFIT
ncbi:hypothetical protein YC2023_090840 [Brassica napus]